MAHIRITLDVAIENWQYLFEQGPVQRGAGVMVVNGGAAADVKESRCKTYITFTYSRSARIVTTSTRQCGFAVLCAISVT